MGEMQEIDYASLSEKERNALIAIESNKSIGEPTAADVIKKQFGGDARKYLKAMGAI